MLGVLKLHTESLSKVTSYSIDHASGYHFNIFCRNGAILLASEKNPYQIRSSVVLMSVNPKYLLID